MFVSRLERVCSFEGKISEQFLNVDISIWKDAAEHRPYSRSKYEEESSMLNSLGICVTELSVITLILQTMCCSFIIEGMSQIQEF